MSELARIQDQLRRAFEGEAWHGPAVLEVLEGVTAAKARARSLAGAHSIWEIVLHVAAVERLVLRRIQGESISLSPDEDWPPVAGTGQDAWRAAVEALESGHEALRRAISRLDDSRLDRPVLEGFSTLYVTLHGLVQHDLYHAGQMALLKKA